MDIVLPIRGNELLRHDRTEHRVERDELVELREAGPCDIPLPALTVTGAEASVGDEDCLPLGCYCVCGVRSHRTLMIFHCPSTLASWR